MRDWRPGRDSMPPSHDRFFYSDGSVAQAPADGFTQDECLVSPHHFTFSGVCYESTNATIQISSPQHPQP